jgi:hypothetical protein
MKTYGRMNTWHPLSANVGTNFTDKRRSLGQYSALADSGHGVYIYIDRLCGLVVRVLGYRSGGPGSIPGTTRKKKVVGLERGSLSLVSTTEELLDRKVAAPV